MTVTTGIRRRGEHDISRKTIARGMPGLFRCTCGDYARVPLNIRTRGYGCIGHPAFPAPSVDRGANVSGKTSGASHRESAEVCVKFEPRHCEEQSDAYRHLRAKAKQSISPRKGRMDCFVAEPVIGRAFARPVGSSQ